MKVTDAVCYLEFFGSCEMVVRPITAILLRRKPCFAASSPTYSTVPRRHAR